jgi:hypothetical protein
MFEDIQKLRTMLVKVKQQQQIEISSDVYK